MTHRSDIREWLKEVEGRVEAAEVRAEQLAARLAEKQFPIINNRVEQDIYWLMRRTAKEAYLSGASCVDGRALSAMVRELLGALEKIHNLKCSDPLCVKSGCAAEAHIWSGEALQKAAQLLPASGGKGK